MKGIIAEDTRLDIQSMMESITLMLKDMKDGDFIVVQRRKQKIMEKEVDDFKATLIGDEELEEE